MAMTRLLLRQSLAPTQGFTVACRQFVQEAKESEASQVELFLNSVPLFKSLSREEKLMLVDALEEHLFPAGTTVITQARAFLQNIAQPSAAKVPCTLCMKSRACQISETVSV